MTTNNEFEFFISPKLVLVISVAIGGLIYFMAEVMLPYSWEVTSNAVSFALLVSFLAICGWIIDEWNGVLGRWFALLLLLLLVHLSALWLRLPGAAMWVIIPVAMAAPLLGLRVAALVAVAESFATLWFAPQMGLSTTLSVSGAVVILVALWIVFAAMFLTRFELRRVALRLSQHYQAEKELLEEARDSRAEAIQAIDDLAHANRQLLLLNKRISDLRLIAEEGQKAKTNFVARVSHELRTPLNMIIGLVDLLLETPEIYDATLSPRMRDALQIVHRNCQHLTNMVNDVLDLSRIETERMVLHKERVSIQEIIGVAVDAVRPLLVSKRLAIELEVEDDLPSVYCDRTRIEQVILNLVSNSARFTEKGKVAVKASRSESHLQVTVEDTGSGISPEDLGRIFEPFAQGTSNPQRSYGGSGLGLSISKQFIELHGGRLWVESEVGVGSSFIFLLPLSSPVDPIHRPGHQIQENWLWRERHTMPSFPDSHYQPRIIVCDETGDLTAMLNRVANGLDLVDVRGYGEAVVALQEAPAQALLLNVATMEEFHRFSAMIQPEARGTPILGCSVPRSLEQVRRLGLQGQLTKPVTRAELEKLLAGLNGTRGNERVKRVLIVDDAPEVAELFTDMLLVCDASLEVAVAHDGMEALRHLRQEAPDLTVPDLILLDHVMPRMDGLQLLEAMARDESIPKVPTYFVSAQAPWDQPPRSHYLAVTTEEGLSLNHLLLSSLNLSYFLLQPESRQDQAPG